MAQLRIKSNIPLSQPKHNSRPSEETNASAITGSAISFSAFPEPPLSIPPTPCSAVFGAPGLSPHTLSPLHTEFRQATASYRHSLSTSGGESSKPSSSKQQRRDNDVTSVSTSNISPYDWHEGASSIDVDAAEDRLLPTSFITSLLQENVGPRGANRTSQFSGLSEMTYPPRNPFIDSLHDGSIGLSNNSSQSQFRQYRRQSYRGSLPSPAGGRAPSSTRIRRKRPVAAVFDDHESGLDTDHNQVIYSTSGSERTLHADQPGSYDENDGVARARLEMQAKSSSDNVMSHMRPARQRSTLSISDGLARQKSTLSTRSAAQSFVSRVSSLRPFRRLLTWRRKPLPPVPTFLTTSNSTEREHRSVEQRRPLPDLVDRATQLHTLLEKGYHPHQSLSSHQTKSEVYVSSFDDAETTAPLRKGREFQSPSPSRSSRHSRVILWMKSHKVWLALGIFIVIAIITVASAVIVTTRRRKVHETSCPADMAGAGCNLNATCVCTGESSFCNPVARAVLDTLPTLNDRLSANLTINAVYKGLWIIGGGLQGASCASQVNYIDVSAIDYQRHPKRAQWAQAALLWTLIQTLDHDPSKQLQNFISKAPWEQLQSYDGPVSSAGSTFTTLAAGFNYDFAAQTITALPASFTMAGQPLDTQVTRVDNRVRPSLDSVYTYAVASSKQQGNALLNYWTTVLHRTEETLKQFVDAFSASPILLPFDATSSSLRNLYQSSSFPPPAACYPGLTPDEEQTISSVEGKVFNISHSNLTSNTFDANCFPLHPTYGTLNVLRLRLPFLDSQNNTAKQALVLKPDAAPRAALAVGLGLATLPGRTNSTQVDPRNYGTTAYANHVILQYLSSVSTNVADAIVKHVLSLSTTPPPPDPDNASAMFPFEDIPSLGVAVFGNIEASDVDSYVSSFTSSDSLFFGSNDGSVFRTWAVGRGRIAWTENATSPEVVYDDKLSNQVFNETWAAASLAIEINARNVGVVNITDSFRAHGLFSP